jgi:peptidoglycan/xylan/chitin deacetylase (PgdA/CDA1 family)
MSKNHGPARCYLAKWSVKVISISAVVVLVTAVNARTAIAPPSVPQAIALEAPAPDLATSLVSFTVQTLTAQPAPTPDSATLTPVPTVAEEQGIPTPVPFIMESPERQPKAARPRLTPMAILASMIATPTATPIPEASPGTAQVPILMYHYISDPPPGSDQLRYSLTVSPSNFDAQMAFLQQAGYHTVTLDDLYDFLSRGAPLPDKPIILTFDDGYADAFTFALPILQKHGFVGTFFILTGPADRNGEGAYLNWAQITAMSQAGMDMELHSREHVDLHNRPNDFLVYQIAGGRDSLQARTGRPVRWFAYPSGRYDDAVVRVLRSAGFVGALTTVNGRTQTVSGLFDMQRIRIGGPGTLEIFIKVLAGNP